MSAQKPFAKRIGMRDPAHMTDVELLEWITRAAYIRGPADTKAYIIPDRIMEEAKKRVTRATPDEGEQV